MTDAATLPTAGLPFAVQPGSTPGSLIPSSMPAAPASSQDSSGAPSPGVSALSSQPEEDNQAPSGGASVFQQLAAKGSPFVKNMAQATNAAAATNPTAAAAPGGWARSILAGAMNALGGGGLTASLGDAAAATEKVPEGGGALTGLARTMAARSQRQTKEKQQQFENQQEADKNRILNAEANARMVHEQQLNYNLGEDAKTSSVKSGQEQLATWRSQASPGVEKMRGLTADEAKAQLQKDNLDPSEETMMPTGIRVMGVDKDGKQQTQVTYSVVKTTPVTLNDEDPDHKATLDRLNKYAPPPGGGEWKSGQTLSGAQYNMLYQQANDAAAVDAARRKQIVAMGVEEEDVKRDEEALAFRKDPNWVRVLATATNPRTGQPDFMAARNILYRESQNPNSPMYGKYNNIDNDMRSAIGYTEGAKGEKSYLFDKMLEDYSKKQDSMIDEGAKLFSDADKAHGPEAAAMAQTFQAKANDPNISPEMRQLYKSKVAQLTKQAQSDVDYAAQTKAAETRAEQDAANGDNTGIMDMVLKYQEDPDKLFSRFKDMKSKRDFIAEIHKIDPTWSDSTYRARYKTAQDFATEGKGGIAKQSLNAFGGHIGDANSLIQSLNNTNSPLLNTPLNKWKSEVLGQPQVLQYRTAIAAAADEYVNFLLNQKAKHASDDELASQLQSPNTSPSMAQGMMRQMANTIAIRARALNKGYRDQMGGQDIPNFLDPDTQQVLKTFGIDPASITKEGPSGLISSGDQNKPPIVPVGGRPIMKNGQTIGYIGQDGKRVNF